MYYRVIILEIKEDYCLALTEEGTVIRIKKKNGLREGDQIYVLDEDFYAAESDAKEQVVLPFTKGRKIKKSYLQKMTAVAAALMVCLASLMIPQMTAPAYAAISFDGEKSVQVEVDKDGRVVDAVSFDDTMSEGELNGLIGKNIADLQEMAAGLNKTDDDLLVVAYAGLKGTVEKSLKDDVLGITKGKDAVYLEGSKDDVKAAKKEGKSLGMYMIEKAASEDRLTDLLDGVPFDHVAKFLAKHRDLIPAAKAEKILNEKKKRIKNDNKYTAEDEADEEEQWDADDQDDENDDDDRITTSGKHSNDDDDEQWKPDDKEDDDDETEAPDDDDDDGGEEEEETED